ncbi:MAG: hypothetical protein IPJ69_03760 [Deltaproteobacteria bacterium]|nr:MAG: hypothetical protein IPJ69_03760 [Deltaproteobacteria bacterium]
MSIQDEKNWQTEFQEFLESQANCSEVPKTLFEKVKNRIFPNPWVVFGKVMLIHAIFGLLSLSVCNQFGLNPFGTDFSLSHWFMKMGGHELCMSLCGVTFMASTYAFSNVFLTLEELESVRRHEWLQTGIFSLISLAAFYFFGAQLVATVTFLWLLGAFIGGILSVESSYYLRRAWSA